MSAGGYDDGYLACPCFWGREPGSLVQELAKHRKLEGLNILDAGCGEGKNAVFFARAGAHVLAMDVSPAALTNAAAAWEHQPNVEWRCADIRTTTLGARPFDVCVAYGLLHCLASDPDIQQVVRLLQAATVLGGYNIICAFNDRRQELSQAHPGFGPCLLPHSRYLDMYQGWRLIVASDTDLWETHPHNNIRHCHSLTRILAQRER